MANPICIAIHVLASNGLTGPLHTAGTANRLAGCCGAAAHGWPSLRSGQKGPFSLTVARFNAAAIPTHTA